MGRHIAASVPLSRCGGSGTLKGITYRSCGIGVIDFFLLYGTEFKGCLQIVRGNEPLGLRSEYLPPEPVELHGKLGNPV
jgi:hypothetical protein